MEQNNNTPREREAYMGYVLAEGVAERAAVVALSLGERDEAVIIPETDGQVLVRQGTSAFLERMNDRGIFKVPVALITVKGGVEVIDNFFVCTK